MMDLKNRFGSATHMTLRIIAALMLFGLTAAERANGAEYRSGQMRSTTANGPKHNSLDRVAVTPIIAQGETLGTIIIYDDPLTPRRTDRLEMYERDGGLIAIAWFDEFGIERLVVDRALIDGGNEIEGIFVAVLIGEPI
jgi:hypothetical protein